MIALVHVLYFVIAIISVRYWLPWYIMEHVVINATLIWIARKVYVLCRRVYKQIFELYLSAKNNYAGYKITTTYS